MICFYFRFPKGHFDELKLITITMSTLTDADILAR